MIAVRPAMVPVVAMASVLLLVVVVLGCFPVLALIALTTKLESGITIDPGH